MRARPASRAQRTAAADPSDPSVPTTIRPSHRRPPPSRRRSPPGTTTTSPGEWSSTCSLTDPSVRRRMRAVAPGADDQQVRLAGDGEEAGGGQIADHLLLDRLPREAVVLGCPLDVGREGLASALLAVADVEGHARDRPGLARGSPRRGRPRGPNPGSPPRVAPRRAPRPSRRNRRRRPRSLSYRDCRTRQASTDQGRLPPPGRDLRPWAAACAPAPTIAGWAGQWRRDVDAVRRLRRGRGGAPMANVQPRQSRLEVIPYDECLRLLDEGRVGRLGRRVGRRTACRTAQLPLGRLGRDLPPRSRVDPPCAAGPHRRLRDRRVRHHRADGLERDRPRPRRRGRGATRRRRRARAVGAGRP